MRRGRKRIAIAAIMLLVLAVPAAHAYPAPTHECPSVSTLYGFKHAASLRLLTRSASCAEALGIVRAMISHVGVTFVGNPEGAAGQFRWTLYGFPGWTCHGDGSGFPEGGAGGVCTKGGAVVEWYHEATG